MLLRSSASLPSVGGQESEPCTVVDRSTVASAAGLGLARRSARPSVAVAGLFDSLQSSRFLGLEVS